ncbi:MAG TPA: phage protein [Acidobacteriaceae bacterium]|jgi:hypothetical protein
MFQYSFASIQLSFTHALAGNFLWNGEQANGGVTIAPLTDHTDQETTPDGAVITNFIPGDSAAFTVTTQQISALHAFLIGWHNACVTAAKLGDLSDYNTAAAIVRDPISGRTHTMQGIAPSKIPDTPYNPKAQMLSWVLKVSNLVTE